MISKLTKSALVAMLTLTLLAVAPTLSHAQQLQGPVNQLTINWNITLSGPPFRGMTPVGAAEYEVEGSRRRFSAEADNVNLPDGSSLNAYVAGRLLGSFTLSDGGGALLLDTLAHQHVPYINHGTRVATYYGPQRSSPEASDVPHEPV